MNDSERRIRERLLATRAEPLAATVEAADAVAASWDGPATRREAVVEPLSAVLDHTGLRERYPALLATGAEVLGESLPAPPVAVPPYVVTTGTGPVLRASLSDGRLVIRLAVFALERDPKRYRRRGQSPEEVLEVELR
ncbi:MAG: hypothetical protein M8354_07110 [Halalkalicoccus sp.]|nr:hypothetical protein [Halalkalicoccus sp.]